MKNCFRIGGDEFAYVYHSDEKDMIPERLKTLELLLKKTAKTHKLDYPLSISAGYAYYQPDIDFDFKDIVRRSDTMLYRQKRRKKIARSTDPGHLLSRMEKHLGVGISIPGIINQEQKLVIKSHALKLENYSLSFLEQAFSVPVYFSNDANAAMMAEDMNIYQNAIYLSLNQTLGGAFCIGGNLFSGENQKAGEFGHMILVPQGRKCYCGKSGCADAYCAAGALVGESKDSVEQFMQLLQNNDEKAEKKWEEYLDYLAILISNLRMAYDMDIILGGEMGGYLSDYMIPLGEKVMKYNGFDHDLRYLKNCSYKKEASAVGAAKHFLQDFIGKI